MKQKRFVEQLRINCVIILLVIQVIQPLRCVAEAHTLLMYVLGCDLESDSGAATDDLLEITRVTKDISVRVIIYLGGCTSWWLPELKNGYCYVVEIADGTRKVLEELGDQESSSDAQFGRFLKKYGNNGDDLILWGHGFPDIPGIGVDSIDNNGILSLVNIQKGLDASGLRFRVFGLDACGMATLEIAWAVSKYAEYFAASPEEEKLSGWDYHNAIACLSKPNIEAVEQLRTEVLQAARRDSRLMPLTVIDLSAFRNNVRSLIDLLDSSPLFTGKVSLNNLAESCADQQTRIKIQELLKGQRLFITGMKDGEQVVLPEIQEHYTSFINRK